MVGRRQAELEETKQLCEAQGGKGEVLAVAGDVSSEEGVKAVFKDVKEVFGELRCTLGVLNKDDWLTFMRWWI